MYAPAKGFEYPKYVRVLGEQAQRIEQQHGS